MVFSMCAKVFFLRTPSKMFFSNSATEFRKAAAVIVLAYLSRTRQMAVAASWSMKRQTPALERKEQVKQRLRSTQFHYL